MIHTPALRGVSVASLSQSFRFHSSESIADSNQPFAPPVAAMSKNFEIMEMYQPDVSPNNGSDAAEGDNEASMHDTGDMRRLGKTQQLNVS